MGASVFRFKKFEVHQAHCAMKVTTPACLFGAWVANELKNANENFSDLLDIGTGTGLLPLMIMQLNDILIDAVEIDPKAAAEAKANVAASGSGKINIIANDIRKLKLQHYDVIVSNPPFYENELASGNEARNMAHHSTELGWKELFEIIRDRLKSQGRFYLLLPFKRASDLEKLTALNNLYLSKLVNVKPSPSQMHSIMLVEGSHQRVETKFSEITIKENDGNYTESFTALLKDYYLYL